MLAWKMDVKPKMMMMMIIELINIARILRDPEISSTLLPSG